MKFRHVLLLVILALPAMAQQNALVIQQQFSAAAVYPASSGLPVAGYTSHTITFSPATNTATTGCLVQVDSGPTATGPWTAGGLVPSTACNEAVGAGGTATATANASYARVNVTAITAGVIKVTYSAVNTAVSKSGSSITGSNPIVVTGSNVSCPTCGTGTGNVAAVPTPLNTQFAQWTDATHIQGVSLANSIASAVQCNDTSITANTITCAPPNAPTSYVDKMLVLLKIANTNTGAATINVSALGTVNVTASLGNHLALSGGEMAAGSGYLLYYDGTQFVLLNDYAWVDAATFPGATADVQISNAIAAASGSRSPIIDARNIPTVTFAANPFQAEIGSGFKPNVTGILLLPGGPVTTNVPFVIPGGWRVLGVSAQSTGNGVNSTQLIASNANFNSPYSTGTASLVGALTGGSTTTFTGTITGVGTNWTAATVSVGDHYTQCTATVFGGKCGGSVTSFTGTTSPLTFSQTNSFANGNVVTLQGFTSPNTALNGQTCTVSSVSGSSFVCTGMTGSGYSSGAGQSYVAGANFFDGIITAILSTTSLTVITNQNYSTNATASNYVITGALIEMGDTSGSSAQPGNFDVGIGAMLLETNKVTGIDGLRNTSCQNLCHILDSVFIHPAPHGVGVDFQSPQMQNSGPWFPLWIVGQGSGGCDTSTIGMLIRASTSFPIGFDETSGVFLNACGATLNGIVIEGPVEYNSGHIGLSSTPGTGIAVNVGSAVEPPEMAFSAALSGSGAIVNHLNCTANGLTCLQFGSGMRNFIAMGIVDASAGGYTNLFVDLNRGATLPISTNRLGLYAVGDSLNTYINTSENMTGITSGFGASIFNAITGFEIGGAATLNHALLGNGTNYVDSAIGTAATTPNFCATDTGSVNAYAIAPSPAATLTTNTWVCFQIANNNTGAATLAVNGLTAKSLTKFGSTALASGDIVTGTYYIAIYDGTQWQIVTNLPGVLSVASTTLTTNILTKGTGAHKITNSATTDTGTLLSTTDLAFGLGTATCAPGTGGVLCAPEGTASTAASAVDQIYADSTLHDFAIQSNGGTSGIIQHTEPGKIRSTGLVAAVTTATLCAATAGACNVAGTYHVHIALYQSGAACSANTTNGVSPSLTWTDGNGTAHSVQGIPMDTNASLVATSGTMAWGATTLGAWGSGDINIDTNGTIIQYAIAFAQCTSGTATYAASLTVSRLQ